MKEIIYDLLEAVIAEVNKPEIKDKLNTALIQPIIQHLTKQLYPYLITTCVIIVLMFICIISTFIILLQNMLKPKLS
jgi:hypothetical protein